MSAGSFFTSLAKWARFVDALTGTPARRRSYARRKIKYTLLGKAAGRSKWMR